MTGHRVAAGEDDLDGEHDPGQLAAGRARGAAAAAARRGAGEQQLDVVDAVRARRPAAGPRRQPVGALALGDGGVHAGVRHGEVGELGADGRAEPAAASCGRGELAGERGELGLEPAASRRARRSGRRRRRARRAGRAEAAQASTPSTSSAACRRTSAVSTASRSCAADSRSGSASTDAA
jgi:hypothetical protein